MNNVNRIIRDLNLTVSENPLLILNLLLAFEEASVSSDLFANVTNYLFHELDYVPIHEYLTHEFTDYSAELIKLCDDPIKTSYINGLLGIPIKYSNQTLIDWRSSIINSRLLRIFHRVTQLEHDLDEKKSSDVTFVCIVGLKGSGKSTLLHQLSNRGHKVIEIYKELFSNNLDKDLPHPRFWADEPLKKVLEKMTYSEEYIFIGSLLRCEEYLYLSRIGKVQICEIATKNTLRYNRLLNRGRKIETNVNKLVSLDLNRFGFKPGYETNDLSFWLSKSEVTFLNNAYGQNLYQAISKKLRLGNR